MNLYLLWEAEEYEAPELHGVYGTRDGATKAGERLRRRWRRENVEIGIGPDEVFQSRPEAYEAADRRAKERLYVTTERMMR